MASGDGGKIHTTDRSLPYKQDLPPKGGYKPITFHRIPARQLMTAPILFGGFALLQGWGIWYYLRIKNRLNKREIEEESAGTALSVST